MNKVRLILLYTCIVFSANTVNASVSNLLALTNNDLGKIKFHTEPKPLNFATFENITGEKVTISDFKGKFILLNFWFKGNLSKKSYILTYLNIYNLNVPFSYQQCYPQGC